MQWAPVHRCIHRLGRYFDETAEFWLGSDLPPPSRAVAEADWRADSRDAYCPRCGGSVGRGEASAAGCASCRGRPALCDGVVRLGPYGGELRGWILAIKYGRRWAEMGELLGRDLGRSVRESGAVRLETAVVVPMPMPWQRRLYRGIDHARVLAEAVAEEIGAPTVPMLRKRHGQPQVALSRTQRGRGPSGGYSLVRRMGGWSLVGHDVVLVDDVRTTGASLRAASAVLRRLKPRRVVAGVVAVTDDWARRDRASQGRRP